MSITQPDARPEDQRDEPADAVTRAYELADEWTGSPDVTIAAAGQILARTLDGPGAVHDLI